MKRMTIANINLLYLFMAAILIIFGSLMQAMDMELGLIGTEFILVLAPAVLFALWTRGDLKRIFRLNPLPFGDGILVASIIILFYPVSITMNMIVIDFLDSIGWYRPIAFPVAGNAVEYAVLLFAIAVSAGICEEFFFRGVVMRAYERYGPQKAILWTAVLFGFFHFNIQNLFGPILLGILFGYFVYLTDSIYAGVLAHALHNALSVTIGFLGRINYEESPGTDFAEAAENGALNADTVAFAITLACAFAAWRLIVRLKMRSMGKCVEGNATCCEELNIKDNPQEADHVAWWSFLPLAAMGVIYILFEIVSRR